MEISNLLEFLGPFQEQISRIYSISSLFISAVIILWVSNLIAGFIHRTYLLGRTFGTFYRNYIHKYLKMILLQIGSLFSNTDKIDAKI